MALGHQLPSTAMRSLEFHLIGISPPIRETTALPLARINRGLGFR